MVKCGCSGRCTCVYIAGPGIELEGSGSQIDPYVFSTTGSGALIEGDAGSPIPVVISGAGTASNPYVVGLTISPFPISPSFQVFNTPGAHEWEKPYAATVRVMMIGGGQGGGAGTSTVGGSPGVVDGGFVVIDVPSSSLPDTVDVYVGNGGGGGGWGQPVGALGEPSVFGEFSTGPGGEGVFGSPGHQVVPYGTIVPVTSNAGEGGSIVGGVAEPGESGWVPTTRPINAAPGGNASSVGDGGHGSGGGVPSTLPEFMAGPWLSGGGGGASSAPGAWGGRGGDGGWPGGSGGGGGAASAPGGGGNGAHGLVVVMSW